MSSRALRKAQREREEQERALSSQHEEAGPPEEDEEEDIVPSVSTKQSAFALLGEVDDEADNGVAVEGDDPAEEATVQPSEQPSEQPTPPKSTAKKKKKKKAKAGGSGTPQPPLAKQEDQLDEIDKALQQLSTNGNAALSGSTVAGVDTKVEEANRLLAIDTHHLHAQNEMRRLFGRAALEQPDDDQPPPNANVGGNRRQQRRVQQAGLAQALRGQGGAAGRSGGLAAMALRRNIFIQGKEEWPVATGGGLGMEIEEKRADGTTLYRFVHNRTYQNVQSQFDSCVESMDPNRLVVLLQHNPYHISTLLQVSEIAKQERDPATSGDLLERALFSFGRAVHSTFAKAIAEGKARMDFARPENREFWLASWRYMQNLSLRATWRTVYEWGKLLLSLSPEEDPYALWLVLDQYALRARQDLDYLNISRNPSFKDVHLSMPNVQLSQGLAEHRAGNKNKGKQALFTAVGRYPWVVARLMQELAIAPPPGVWGKEPRTEKEKLHSELYASRAKDLWNTPEMTSLLTEIASALPPETPPAPVDRSNISRNEARNVLLSDVPALIALIPRKYTTALMSASDPLPPEKSVVTYQTMRPSQHTRVANHVDGSVADNLRELQGLYGFFSNLFPWFNPAREAGTHEEDAEGPDGAAPDTPHPSEAEIERRIREAGISEEIIVERTQRMMLLQQQLMGEADEDEISGFEPVPSDSGREPQRRARVEDASEDET